MTTSQTLEISGDTANLRRGVQRQNFQYSDVQGLFYKNQEAQHAKNTFENRLLVPLRYNLK